MEIASRLKDPLKTTWPVIAEAMHLIGDHSGGIDALWAWLTDGVLDVLPLEKSDFAAMRDLMHKYRDLPMDLADASLIHLAARHRVDRIFTTDRRDFGVYARGARYRFTLIPG